MQPKAPPDRDIAEALVVTEPTVETDLTHAYAKLDVDGREFLYGVLA